MSCQAKDNDLDAGWGDWIAHDGAPRPSNVRLGDLVQVCYFEVSFSSLRWHRDAFVVGERELGMSWADWRIWSLIAYRVNRADASAAKALRALYQLAHDPMPTRRPTATHLLEHLGAPKRASDPFFEFG